MENKQNQKMKIKKNQMMIKIENNLIYNFK